MVPTLLSVEVSLINWDDEEKESGRSKSLSPSAAAQSSIRYSEGNYRETHTGSSHTEMTHRDTSQRGHTEIPPNSDTQRHLPTGTHRDLTKTPPHRDLSHRGDTPDTLNRHKTQTPHRDISPDTSHQHLPQRPHVATQRSHAKTPHRFHRDFL